jgi:protein TonB
MTISASIFESAHFRPKENIGRMRGLVLILVVALHFLATIWVLKPIDPSPKKPPQIIEITLLKKPEPVKVVPVVKEPPPAPVMKKEPIVKPKPVVVKPLEPVKKVAPPKPIAQPKVLTTVSETAETSIPKFESAPAAEVAPPSQPLVEKAVAKPVETSGRGDDDKVTSGVVPVVRVPPKYPPRAAQRHLEGWVKVEFTITPAGEVEDAVVKSAEPEEIFDDAALNAIAKWEFKAKIVNGVAVKQRAVQTLQFKLAN